MTDKIKYTCTCCGQEHDEWPALVFSSPDSYEQLTVTEKETIAEIYSDFCIINHLDQTDRFIRCVLKQKVIDHCEDLEYGLWVTLSEKSFTDYSENYDNELHETSYFGWLANDIREYQFDGSIPATVHTKTGGLRPEIIPHDDFDHAFVKDYYNGITKLEAERRIRAMLDIVDERNKQS